MIANTHPGSPQRIWTLADIVRFTSSRDYSVVFENSFGRIKADRLVLYDSEIQLGTAETTGLKLIETYRSVNRHFIGVMIVLTLAACRIDGFQYSLAGMLTILVLIDIKWKTYRLQLNIVEASPISVKIRRRQLVEATEFIWEYNSFRQVS